MGNFSRRILPPLRHLGKQSLPMGEYDHSYKYLFSHARMVEDLLKGFVREEWVTQLDFSTLEKVNSSYVSDALQERQDDIVWRIRGGET